MAQLLSDIMTPDPITLTGERSVQDAAKAMKGFDVGDIFVMDDGQVCGIVTDRDIVVRAVAAGQDPAQVRLRDICSKDLVSLPSSQSVEKAIQLMRERAIRRLPVIDDGVPVGVVSLGDLALERDPGSALADISAAEGNT